MNPVTPVAKPLWTRFIWPGTMILCVGMYNAKEMYLNRKPLLTQVSEFVDRYGLLERVDDQKTPPSSS